VTATPPGRAGELVRALELAPHPEGGWYREWFRSRAGVATTDGRGARSALTCIDFLLGAGQFSAWHRVASDELWQLYEGRLRLWTMPASLDAIDRVELGEGGGVRRAAVPAGAWQAAEPMGELAWIGATVGPGFDFADFSFLRHDADALAALTRLRPELLRLK
jgi:predicted cupin superfamily sugar epimerase